MRKLFSSIIIALSLSAAVTPAMAVSAPSFNITDVLRATDEDLNAAIADATSRSDDFAVQCYSGILEYNHNNPKKTFSVPKNSGPVSAFQNLRDTVKTAQAGIDLIPKEIILACGPLDMDVRADIANLGTFFLGIRWN